MSGDNTEAETTEPNDECAMLEARVLEANRIADEPGAAESDVEHSITLMNLLLEARQRQESQQDALEYNRGYLFASKVLLGITGVGFVAWFVGRAIGW